MDPKEKKEMVELVGEVIDRKITPRLEKLEKGQSKLEAGQEKLGEQNQTIIDQVVQNSEDITILQTDIKDVLFTEERIETKVDASIRRQDDISIKCDQLNRRVLRLETKKVQ